MINISQSLITHLYFKGETIEVCPRNLYEVWIKKTHKLIPSDAMLYGQYGETLCLGHTAYSSVTDLPRKELNKKQQKQNQYNAIRGIPPVVGEKKIVQLRIEEQAVEFKRMQDSGEIEVYGTQVRLQMPLNDKYSLGGITDMFPFAHNDPNTGESWLGVGDLKFSQTLDNNRYDTKYPWAAFDIMDKTQAFLYLMLLRNIDNPMNKEVLSTLPPKFIELVNTMVFEYLVFEYGGKLRHRSFVVQWNEDNQKELDETIRKVMARLDYYEANEWEAEPDINRCSECPIMNCNKRITAVVYG